jgi:hypothetical protein
MQPPASRIVAPVLSVVSVLFMATVAATPGSPFQPVLPAAAQPSGPFRALADALGLGSLSPEALAVVGVAAVSFAAVAFVLVVREAWHGRLSVRTVVVMTLAYHLVVALLPLLFSRDVYSYAYYGRIASTYGANPYVSTPADFPNDVLRLYVGPKWVDTPAVYGPLWTLVSAGVVRIFTNVTAIIDAFRALAIVASLTTFATIGWVVARRRPARQAFALAAFGLNPVVLFQTVAGGHNDLWVGLAIIGGLALLVARRPYLAVAALTLGALVKASAAIAVVLLVVGLVAAADRERRARVAAGAIGTAAAVALVFAAPFLQTDDPTLGMLELATHEGWLAPSRFFRRIFDIVSLGALVRVAFAVMLLLALGALLVRVVRDAPRMGPDDHGAAWDWGLLLLILLGPVLLPWYVVWVLPLVWVVPRVPRLVTLGVGVALTVSQFAAEPERFGRAFDANLLFGHYVITPFVVALLVWLLVDLRRRLRDGAPLADEPEREPAHDRDG